MFGKYWVTSREDLVTRVENGIIIDALRSGYDVMVDATNIGERSRKRWERMAGLYKSELEYVTFEVPLWKAVLRDWKRGLFGGRMVGIDVIKRFYNKRQC